MCSVSGGGGASLAMAVDRLCATVALHLFLLSIHLPGKQRQRIYRVTRLVGYNLLLTLFQQFWQLIGSYCSYLLPRQDG